METRVERVVPSRELTVGVFIDTEGKVHARKRIFRIYEEGVQEMGSKVTELKLIGATLENRRIETTTNETQIVGANRKRVSTGGVLSPLLCSLVEDGLLLELNCHGTYAQWYADVTELHRGEESLP